MPITQSELGTTGRVIWPDKNPVWKFDFSLSTRPDGEGLVIRNARFRDQLLLYKGSLPMVRVQYDNGYLSIDHLETSTAQWMATKDPRAPKLVGVYENFSAARRQRYLMLANFHYGGPLGAYR